jgi:DNA-binding SARP family transcriptional activator/predicted ATPase/Tfp pilus assembly protein PilF
MTRLILALLGPLQITLAGEPLTAFRSDKERALLSFLALEADRPHRREALVGLLWPEQPEALAFSNLRKSLHRLRQTLRDQDASPPLLLITPKTVQFNPHSAYQLDVAEFAALLDACRQHAHRHLESCAACHQRLRQAAHLYRGDLLQGFFLADSLAFDEWILVKREWLRRQALDALYALSEFSARQGEYALAQHYAHLQLALEPWREAAHRQLMRALALNGQRGAALAQYEACRRVLAAELGVEPETEIQALYERIRADEVQIGQPDFKKSPAEQLRATLQNHNLVAQMTPLIGRAVEIERLTSWLLDPADRLITLIGEGGIGKTRLAYAAAARVQGDFLQGVWLVPLAGLTVGDVPIGSSEHAHLHTTIATAIANAIGFAFFGKDEPKVQLLNYLREKELLLVLDNFEHVLAGADLILDMLRLAPKLVVLVTSREPLNFQAEHIFRLEGLPVPSASDPDAGAYSSVQLFAERAQRAAPRFVLDASTLPAVAQVCQFLDGLPLGIELAAAWARRRSAAEIAQALHAIDFLATTQRDVAARHRSMRAVFEGSWQLLSARHQAMLMQASVFRGGFSEEAACVVLDSQPEDMWALVDKSLLRQSPAGRYEMHELLRQFAAEKLADDLTSQAVQRHSAFYMDYLGRSSAAFRGRQPHMRMAEIRGELENIRQAWNWALAEAQLDLLERGLNGLAAFYDFSSLYQEGVGLFELTIERLSAALKPEQSELPTQSPTLALLAQLWMNLSRCLFNRARYEDAATAAQRAIHLAQIAHQLDSQAMAYLRWGYALWRGGDFGAARQRIEHALRLANDLQSPNLEADCLRGLGNVLWNQGHLAEAQTYYEQALRLYRATNDRWSEGRTLTNLGMVASSQADHARARAYYEQALSLCQDAGDTLLEFHIRNELGAVALEQGDFTEARAHFEQALSSYREVGDRYNEGTALGNLGDVSLQQGDYAAARIYYEQALRLFRAIGARLGESIRLAYLGLLHHYQGDDAAASEFSRQALQLAQDLGARREQGYALTNLGHALTRVGHLAEAEVVYQQAIAVRQELGVRSRMMEPLAGLARVAFAQGDTGAALGHVEEILMFLKTGSLAGADAPFRVYLTCYRVLQAQHDPRGPGILQIAHQMLQARVAAISDERLRRSFLEQVPEHRELAWEHDRLA